MAETFAVDFSHAAEEAIEEKGWTCVVMDPKGDWAQEYTIIENLITQKVDGIIYTAIDADGANDLVAEVQAAGIPIVGYDCLASAGVEDAAVRYDDTKGGEMAAEEMMKALEGKIVFPPPVFSVPASSAPASSAAASSATASSAPASFVSFDASCPHPAKRTAAITIAINKLLILFFIHPPYLSCSFHLPNHLFPCCLTLLLFPAGHLMEPLRVKYGRYHQTSPYYQLPVGTDKHQIHAVGDHSHHQGT